MDPVLAAAMAAAGMLFPRPKKFGAAAAARQADAGQGGGGELSAIEAAQLDEDEREEEVAFTQYTPRHVREGQPHPDPVVESSSLAGCVARRRLQGGGSPRALPRGPRAAGPGCLLASLRNSAALAAHLSSSPPAPLQTPASSRMRARGVLQWACCPSPMTTETAPTPRSRCTLPALSLRSICCAAASDARTQSEPAPAHLQAPPPAGRGLRHALQPANRERHHGLPALPGAQAAGRQHRRLLPGRRGGRGQGAPARGDGLRAPPHGRPPLPLALGVVGPASGCRTRSRRPQPRHNAGVSLAREQDGRRALRQP